MEATTSPPDQTIISTISPTNSNSRDAPTTIPNPPLLTNLINTPAQLTTWRRRLFHLSTPLLLTTSEYHTLWPLVANIWLAQKRTPYDYSATGYRTVYLCRAGKAVKPRPKDQLPPDKKRRNRKVRSNPVECKATMKYTPLKDGRHLLERRGLAHGRHGIGESDRVKRPKEEYEELKREMEVDYIALGISAGKAASDEDDERDLRDLRDVKAGVNDLEMLKPVPGNAKVVQMGHPGESPREQSSRGRCSQQNSAGQCTGQYSGGQYVQQHSTEQHQQQHLGKEHPSHSYQKLPPTPQTPYTPQKSQSQQIQTHASSTPNTPINPQRPPETIHTQISPTYAKSTDNTHVALTPSPLPVPELLDWAKHPSAGAVVMFMGTTRAFSRPEGAFVAAPAMKKDGNDGADGGGSGESVNGTTTFANDGVNRRKPNGAAVNGNAHTIIHPNPCTTATTSKSPPSPQSGPPQQPPMTTIPTQLQQGGYEPISSLTYTTYGPLAIKTLHSIAIAALSGRILSPIDNDECSSGDGKKQQDHTVEASQSLNPSAETADPSSQNHNPTATPTQTLPILKIAITHRLGPVPIGEESILVVVSGVHRGECWRVGERVLEEVKRRVEVWKFEEFVDWGEGGWRRNAVDG